MRPEYTWDIPVNRELMIGTKEYYRFRQWLKITGRFNSQMRLTSLKPEYLNWYLDCYRIEMSGKSSFSN